MVFNNMSARKSTIFLLVALITPLAAEPDVPPQAPFTVPPAEKWYTPPVGSRLRYKVEVCDLSSDACGNYDFALATYRVEPGVFRFFMDLAPVDGEPVFFREADFGPSDLVIGNGHYGSGAGGDTTSHTDISTGVQTFHHCIFPKLWKGTDSHNSLSRPSLVGRDLFPDSKTAFEQYSMEAPPHGKTAGFTGSYQDRITGRYEFECKTDVQFDEKRELLLRSEATFTETWVELGVTRSFRFTATLDPDSIGGAGDAE